MYVIYVCYICVLYIYISYIIQRDTFYMFVSEFQDYTLKTRFQICIQIGYRTIYLVKSNVYLLFITIETLFELFLSSDFYTQETLFRDFLGILKRVIQDFKEIRDITLLCSFQLLDDHEAEVSSRDVVHSDSL